MIYKLSFFLVFNAFVAQYWQITKMRSCLHFFLNLCSVDALIGRTNRGTVVVIWRPSGIDWRYTLLLVLVHA